MSLTTQTKQFFITIRKNVELNKDDIASFLALQTGLELYAYICHDRDISPTTGELEGIHYHFTIVRKKTRISTMYNLIREVFNFSNVNGIKVECAKSIEGCIQYLIHKNNPEKTQHDPIEIITNLPKEELKDYLETEDNSLTFEKVYYLCISSKDIINVIQSIGFTRYNLYRNTIQDIWKAVQVEKMKHKEYEERKKRKKLNDDLTSN